MSGATGIEQVKRTVRGQAIVGLALEINTGMVLSHRGSGLDACRIQGVLPEGRTTRKAGLRNAVKNMKKLYPDWQTPASVTKALEK